MARPRRSNRPRTHRRNWEGARFIVRTAARSPRRLWCEVFRSNRLLRSPFLEMNGWRMSICNHGGQFTVWCGTKLIFPESSPKPLQNHDLPDDVAVDSEEARSILQKSPRGAAAIFRLCIQDLCAHLGESGRNLRDDNAEPVRKGLSTRIQRSLDAVRFIGNGSVHPGTMYLRDQPETAVHLATLINAIAEALITQPKLVDEVYERLPAGKRDEIAGRDTGFRAR